MDKPDRSTMAREESMRRPAASLAAGNLSIIKRSYSRTQYLSIRFSVVDYKIVGKSSRPMHSIYTGRPNLST